MKLMVELRDLHKIITDRLTDYSKQDKKKKAMCGGNQ